MSVKNLLKGFRKELDQVIVKHLPGPNTIITMDNIDSYNAFLKTIQHQTVHGPTVIFTNANGWYIDTLVKNLFQSISEVETYAARLGVVCTDKDGYETAKKHFKHVFLAHIPLLKVDDLTSVKQEEDYTRLVFIKTVLIYHALQLGYAVVYLDPDMAFLQPCLQYVVDATLEHGLVLAGFKDGNMNTNIIGVVASPSNIELFKVDSHTFEANMLNRKIYHGFCGSDEEFLVMKDEYDPEKIHFLSLDYFPPGVHMNSVKRENVKVLHANGVKGLKNKVEFLRENNGWYL
jgi:hypothetical protein